MSSGYKGGKERKLELELQRKINCGRCPYHDKENYGRRPKEDRGKNHRREGK